MRVQRLAALLFVTVLIALLAPVRAESLDRPSLTVGDYWTYRTNTSFEAGFDLLGQVTSSVTAGESATVLNVPQDVFRVVLNGSGTISGQVSGPVGTGSVSGTWIVTGEELLETDQLKTVSSVLDLSVDGLFQGVVPFSIRATNTTTYHVVFDGWRFPVSVGSSGAVNLSYVYTQDFFAFGNQSHARGAGNLTLTYSMGNGISLDTPAGRFTAYPIREAWPDGTYDERYFSAAVGNDVKTESYNGTGVLVSTAILQSYRYQVLEPARFLGLTLVEWGLLVPILAGVGIVGIVLWRRSRKKRVLPPSLREPPT
ncbi:MAG: hypothetical protein WC985_01300 [Thermoplasmata archaeon]